MDAGVTGVAVSVDSLRAGYHDRFRDAASRDRRVAARPASEPFHGPAGAGALDATLAAVERCRERGLDFIVQTTVTRGNRDELGDLMAWAEEAGAVAFNAYFLVATGRARGMHGLSPEENDAVLGELLEAEAMYRGRMMVRSKCQPQIMRHAHEARERGGAESPLLSYAKRCPCGIHYARVTPDGKLTPCPYTPAVAGDLLRDGFQRVWRESPVLRALRSGALGGKCGDCRYREVCGGCRARAHAETGDLLGPDLSCSYEPDGLEEAVASPAGVTYGSPAPRTEDGEADPGGPPLPWTDGARSRVERIPSFVRGVVTDRVERFARERGYEQVDEEVMAEVRRAVPVDFSKRLPFFMRKGADA